MEARGWRLGDGGYLLLFIDKIKNLIFNFTNLKLCFKLTQFEKIFDFFERVKFPF